MVMRSGSNASGRAILLAVALLATIILPVGAAPGLPTAPGVGGYGFTTDTVNWSNGECGGRADCWMLTTADARAGLMLDAHPQVSTIRMLVEAHENSTAGVGGQLRLLDLTIPSIIDANGSAADIEPWGAGANLTVDGWANTSTNTTISLSLDWTTNVPVAPVAAGRGRPADPVLTNVSWELDVTLALMLTNTSRAGSVTWGLSWTWADAQHSANWSGFGVTHDEIIASHGNATWTDTSWSKWATDGGTNLTEPTSNWTELTLPGRAAWNSTLRPHALQLPAADDAWDPAIALQRPETFPSITESGWWAGPPPMDTNTSDVINGSDGLNQSNGTTDDGSIDLANQTNATGSEHQMNGSGEDSGHDDGHDGATDDVPTDNVNTSDGAGPDDEANGSTGEIPAAGDLSDPAEGPEVNDGVPDEHDLETPGGASVASETMHTMAAAVRSTPGGGFALAAVLLLLATLLSLALLSASPPQPQPDPLLPWLLPPPPAAPFQHEEVRR